MSRYDKLPTMEELSPEAIQSEVERILSSEKFARSKRLRSLLRFTVAQTLQGQCRYLEGICHRNGSIKKAGFVRSA